LKPNCPGMIIGRSFTKFCLLCLLEIQDGRHCRTKINIGPYGKMLKCPNVKLSPAVAAILNFISEQKT
jgi:hypothetical protein